MIPPIPDQGIMSNHIQSVDRSRLSAISQELVPPYKAELSPAISSYAALSLGVP